LVKQCLACDSFFTVVENGDDGDGMETLIPIFRADFHQFATRRVAAVGFIVWFTVTLKVDYGGFVRCGMTFGTPDFSAPLV
jgi:hypothetical protein